MAQLIKLDNYISRYELDIYRYPGQFIRMKKQRWERVERELIAQKQVDSGIADHDPREPPPSRLKREFAEDVFLFQLRWASSTLREKSDLDPRYRFDAWLKFFLLSFPDNYLLMYRPVFQIRQAPIELDIVLIGPTALWCITVLDGADGDVFEGDSGRYWQKIADGDAERVLSPLVSNMRTYELITRLLGRHDEASVPVRRAVLSPLAYIEYTGASGVVDIVDRRGGQLWLERMRSEPSPLKSVQLKTAGYLLRHCQKVAVER